MHNGSPLSKAVICRFVVASGLALLPAVSRASCDGFPFRVEDNRVFIDVSANGVPDLVFLVDTGSDGSTISAELHRRLALPMSGHGVADGAGESRIADDRTTVASIRFGHFELASVPVAALQYDLLRRAIGFSRFDGVLGSDLFDKYAVTFDFDARRLCLATPASFVAPAGAVAMPLQFTSGAIPFVRAEIGGVPAKLEIDTGDRFGLTLFGPFWRAHGMQAVVSPAITAMTGYGVGGPVRSIVGRLPRFALGEINVHGMLTRLSLQSTGLYSRSDYAGVIGGEFLRNCNVTFDYARNTMYLVRRSAARSPEAFDRSGMWIGRDADNRPVVMDVVPDGPAQRAGIQAGDLVSAIDGRPVGPTDILSIRDRLQDGRAASAIVRVVHGGAAQNYVLVLKDLIARMAVE